MEAPHCTHIDPETHAECRFMGATLTTLAYVRQEAGGSSEEMGGVYWFAYLCDDHLARARASGHVVASTQGQERSPMETTETRTDTQEIRGQMPDPQGPAEVPPQDPRQDGVPPQDPQEEGLPADDPDGEEVGAEAPLA